MKIVNYNEKNNALALNLFYRCVFHHRKEFEYARFPTWFHRYSLVDKSIIRLAYLDDTLIGSLGLLVYDGYVQGKKQKIGFFVDNCVHPEYASQYDNILSSLCKEVERQAKEEGITHIIGWEYTKHVEAHNTLYSTMGYSRIDGINWFGGGTKHVDCFPENNFRLSFVWKTALHILNYQIHRKINRIKPLHNVSIHNMEDSDIPAVVTLINTQNSTLEYSPRYTSKSLEATIQKYHAKGFVMKTDGQTIGVVLYFVAPWSGWMYGKPTYSKKYGTFLIRHPLEFAIDPKYTDSITPHLIKRAMMDEKLGNYVMYVDVFDRRIAWLQKACVSVGADELPYDFGTLFYKNLSGKNIETSKLFYVPTHLVISPYTTKDY